MYSEQTPSNQSHCSSPSLSTLPASLSTQTPRILVPPPSLYLIRIRDRRTPRKFLQPLAILANVLGYLLRLLALLRVGRRLDLEHAAVCVGALARGQGVHGLLEGVVLPAEEVVAVLAVSGAVMRSVSIR